MSTSSESSGSGEEIITMDIDDKGIESLDEPIVDDIPSMTTINDDMVVFHLDNNNNVGFRDENLDIDVYGVDAKPFLLSEDAFFTEYRRLFLESMIVSVLVRFLADEIAGSAYYFEGPEDDVESVENFFFENDVRDHLEEVVMQGILYGTGLGFVDLQEQPTEEDGSVDTTVTDFRRIDVNTVDLQRDDQTADIDVIQKAENRVDEEDLPINDENRLMLRFIRWPDTPWGVSFLRGVLMGAQGLDDLFRDIPPAIKQLAYLDRVLKLDLSEIGDPEQKKSILQNSRDAFEGYDSATTTVIAMDAESELGFMGTVGGGGGSQRRVDKIMPIIEPIMMFVLLSFNMAPGEVMQTGANRSIIEQQSRLARKRINTLREKFKREVEKSLIAPILGEEGKPSVQLRYKPDPIDPEDEAEVLREEFRNGLITREEFRERRGFRGTIEDDDTTFADLPESIRKSAEVSVRQDETTEAEDEATDSVDEAREQTEES